MHLLGKPTAMHHAHTRLLAVVALGLAASFGVDLTHLHAQQSLLGTVVDEYAQPAIAATVGVLHGDSLIATTTTDFDGHYRVELDPGLYDITFAYIGYDKVRIEGFEVLAGQANRLDVALEPVGSRHSEETAIRGSRMDPPQYLIDGVRVAGGVSPTVPGPRPIRRERSTPPPATATRQRISAGRMRTKLSSIAAGVCIVAGCHPEGHRHLSPAAADLHVEAPAAGAGEHYRSFVENAFALPRNEPLSTFGADVDVAAYANVRRFLTAGERPPADAVRPEELINYFDYDYPAPPPASSDPVAFATELAECPWNPEHALLRIGVQARELPTDQLPPSNLVFLVDVSGSMNSPDKLPLLKQGFRLLVAQLRPQDTVSVVVYAGAAGTVLGPTSGADKRAILGALERLRAGGSTAGAAGLKLAYQLAEEHFAEGGNNRIVLATDGDFNVGTTDDQTLEDYVAAKRATGIALSVVGFGTGNYQDARMQTLAEHGDGNAAYIDNLLEAQKVFVAEFGGTLHTVARDVKLQVEFNPARVAAYRLLGYESRLLAPEDFNDDRKDAGDMGSGHTVTALYELIPAGVESDFLPRVDALKYQRAPGPTDAPAAAPAAPSDEWATVRMKYKHPGDQRSQAKIERSVAGAPAGLADASVDYRWAAAVAGWSLHLGRSDYFDAERFGYDALLTLAEGARGADREGYRAEAVRLMRIARGLASPDELVEVGAHRRGE